MKTKCENCSHSQHKTAATPTTTTPAATTTTIDTVKIEAKNQAKPYCMA